MKAARARGVSAGRYPGSRLSTLGSSSRTAGAARTWATCSRAALLCTGRLPPLNKRLASFADSEIMKFRLTYTGELLSSSGDPRHKNKMAIRRALHPQLARLWQTDPVVKPPPETFRTLGNWCFVPLVSRYMDLVCGLEVLMLRDEGVAAASVVGSPRNLLRSLRNTPIGELSPCTSPATARPLGRIGCTAVRPTRFRFHAYPSLRGRAGPFCATRRRIVCLARRNSRGGRADKFGDGGLARGE
jgi:hypothetical protein